MFGLSPFIPLAVLIVAFSLLVGLLFQKIADRRRRR